MTTIKTLLDIDGLLEINKLSLSDIFRMTSNLVTEKKYLITNSIKLYF